jgi:hypothetical protein
LLTVRSVTSTPVSRDQDLGIGLDEHCRSAVLGLRAALLDLYVAVGADAERPQEVSRQFKLDKSLTWKISKILRSDDALEAVALIPGAEGMGRLLKAMSAAGATEAATERVREAMRGFERMVVQHAGDRTTLDLYLDSMCPSASLQESRRLAYLGNSGILGIQTRVRFATRFITPSAADPGRLDFALVTGLRDLRRLRPIAAWPIYRFLNFKDDLSAAALSRSVEPLEPHGAAGQVDWLMPTWSSSPPPALRVREVESSIVFELVEGPVGRTGETDLTFGYVDRGAVPRFATASDRLGQFATGVTTPAETMLLDFFVHRSMPEVRDLAIRLVTPVPGLSGDAGIVDVPIVLEAIPLPGSRLDGQSGSSGQPGPLAATPLVPDYQDLVQSVFRGQSWDPADFYGLRIIVDHPPLHATILTSHELPPSPRER